MIYPSINMSHLLPPSGSETYRKVYSANKALRKEYRLQGGPSFGDLWNAQWEAVRRTTRDMRGKQGEDEPLEYWDEDNSILDDTILEEADGEDMEGVLSDVSDLVSQGAQMPETVRAISSLANEDIINGGNAEVRRECIMRF